MNKIGQILRYSFKLNGCSRYLRAGTIINRMNLTYNMNYNFVQVIKSKGNQEIIDQDKLIQALEESLISISEPKQGLENVNNLINLKQLKYNGNNKYTNYEADIFTKANVYYSLKDFAECNRLIEEILNSNTASKEVITRTLILKSSLIQHVENNYKDSLKVAKQAEQIIQDLNNSTAKELKVIIYHMIGEIQSSIFQDRKEGQEYLQRAINIINDEIENNYMLNDKEKGQYMQRLANCYDSIAEIYHLEDKYDECKQIMGQCIELWKNNQFKQPFQYANSLLRQGKISTDRGEYTQALEKFSRAMKLMQGYENTDQFIVLCLNTSQASKGSNKFDKSLEVIKEAQQQLHHLNEMQKNYYTCQVLEELIDVYLNQGSFEEAHEVIKQFKNSLQGEVDNQRYKILKQEIVILLCQEKYQEVIECSDRLMAINNKLFGENNKEQAELLSSKGISQIYLKQSEEGFQSIQKSADILQDKGCIDEVQEIWNQVVAILEEQNNYNYVVKALGFLRRSIQVYVEKQGGEAGIIIEYIDQQIQTAKQKSQEK